MKKCRVCHNYLSIFIYNERVYREIWNSNTRNYNYNWYRFQDKHIDNVVSFLLHLWSNLFMNIEAIINWTQLPSALCRRRDNVWQWQRSIQFSWEQYTCIRHAWKLVESRRNYFHSNFVFSWNQNPQQLLAQEFPSRKCRYHPPWKPPLLPLKCARIPWPTRSFPLV